MTTPAKIVIQNCGGYKAVSVMLKVDVSRVYRWTYDRARGGTGGIIPAKHQALLLIRAREAGLKLSPKDFFPECHSELCAGLTDRSGDE